MVLHEGQLRDKKGDYTILIKEKISWPLFQLKKGQGQ